jgi:hypothetical protein
MSIAEGALWFADCKEGVVKRVSLGNAEVLAIILTGLANGKEGELNVAAGAGSIWVASDPQGAIKRIDAKTNEVIATIPTQPGAYYPLSALMRCGLSAPRATLSSALIPKPTPSPKPRRWASSPAFLPRAKARCGCRNRATALWRASIRHGRGFGPVKVGAVLKYGDIDTGGKVWLRSTEDQTLW